LRLEHAPELVPCGDKKCRTVAVRPYSAHARMPLQGEHGTGRNVAPYVEMEWGTTAYELMWELKELFDPDYVLNPGVILNKARRGREQAVGLA